ncbi:MAG: DUF1643 domain-containing protein [Dysosmobacter welbionis]
MALSNGYDSFLMFNVYAQRATRPDDMERSCNPVLHAENRRAFRYLLSVPGPRPVGRLGNIIEKRGYLMDCMRDFAADASAAGAGWFTAGPLLKSGHPHHPLYLKGDTKLLAFDIDRYLRPGHLNRCEAQAGRPQWGRPAVFLCHSHFFFLK